MRRDRNMQVEPALAERWEQPSPTVWRFHLRRGVKFTDGTPFTADDVVFSAARVRAQGSNMQSVLASVKEVRRVDDHTVEFETSVPNPILLQEITNWGIMSKQWSEKNNATRPADLTTREENFATRNAMGTGPFRLVSREPDRRTVLERNPDWWDKPAHNLQRVEFTIIANDATRVAALLSGEIDFVYTVPPQDVERIRRTPGMQVIQGPELRTIYLGIDQNRPQLLKSDVKGKNPFQDVRVRRAFNMAIDAPAIQRTVMRGQSRPTGPPLGPRRERLPRGRRQAPARGRRGRQAPARRGRLPERLRRHDGLPERPLRERRGDLHRRGVHAGADRRAGDARRADPRALLRRDQRAALQHQLLPARLDAGDLGRAQRRCSTSRARATARAACSTTAATATRTSTG